MLLTHIPQDLLSCMKSVGMNPSEQELLDMINEVRISFLLWEKCNKFVLQVEKKGVIYFEDVCKLILRKFREDDESEFIKIMFKVGPMYLASKLVRNHQ